MAVFSYTGIVCVFLIFCYCSELFGHSVGSSVRECERISPFYGGEVTYINDTEGRSNAFYSCEDAYSLFPSDIDFSNCTKRRKWKPEPPKCLRKAEVEIPDHGKVCKGKSDIILHSESYAVCCDKGYELYNDIYLEKKRVHIKNNNGSLEPNIPECKEARCDPSDQNMANVQYLNGSNTMTKFPSRTVVLLSCKDGYDYYRGDRPMTTPLLRTCVKGSILKAPKCKEARCLFSGYPSNKDTYQRVYLGDAQLVFDDQYIEPRQKIEVFCHKSRQYELFVNSTETHLEEFISECKHGQFDHKKEEFPTCVERRCSVSVSSEVCFWMDDREHCKANNFTIPSRSSVHMRCRDGYKLSRSEDGRSVEVDEDALIMCNKGVYDESYRCISEPCAVPKVKYAKLISKDASSYEHGENITFACDTGFHFYQNISTKINAFETTCNLVQWTDDIPSGCKPDGCKLDLLEGSKYYSADKTVEIANATLIKHTTSIRMQCRDMFDLFNENNNIFRDNEYMPAVMCYQGKWRNQHFCKKRCGTLNITNGKLIKDGRNVTEGETIAHGESVYVKNNNKKADSDLPADSAMECHDGEWQNFVGVSSSSSTPATTTEIITTIAIDSTTISETNKQSRGKDVLPEKKQIKNTRNKGCTLPDDPRYTYTDFDDNYKDPGSFISDGTTLTVACATLDLYDFYTSSYDYDYNNDSTPTITCMNNTLSQLDLDCPEVTPNTCKELQHGSVNEKNGYFIVSCDKGYSLDLIVPERPQCTCENGQLKSVFGGQAPACIPDKCVVPYEFDVRLSVTDRRRVSLSGGSVVEVGDFVYFNCSKPGILKYEPLNRRFQCVNGLWKEAERDHNWKLGYDGEFPACRAAICEPNCTNGGICFKDDNCRCKHLTEGKLCEKFICEDTCFENGGKCIGPGRCFCPAERFGHNCEQKGCILPKHAAHYEGQRIVSPGTTLNNFACDSGYVLSSQNGMTCRDGGTWSQIVKCIKGCTRPNHAANSKDWRKTFSPEETLNNFYCDHGYVLSSQNVMTCRRDGSWSQIVTCIKGCTRPNHAANSKDWRTTFSPGETLNSLYCDHGFVLSSQHVMTCRHDGSWSQIVTCIKGCTRPNHAANSKDWRTIVSPGETLNNFYCDHGYGLSSQNGMTCRHDGSWSQIVTCIKVQPKKCVHTYDAGHNWYPLWNKIHKYHCGYKQSARDCKESCLNQKKIPLKSVFYNIDHKTCWCLAVSSKSYFVQKYGRWNSLVYLLSCK